MSNYQSQDNNNRGRRNINYGRNNNQNFNGQRNNQGGYGGHRERSNSDPNIQMHSGPTSERFNYNNRSNDNRNRHASPGNDNRGSYRSRSPVDRYPISRRRVVPTQEYRGNEAGPRPNLGTRIPNPFAPREESNNYSRNNDRRSHNNDRYHDRGHESGHFSGRPAPYKQDTNKLKRIDCLEFFKMTLEELRNFCRNEEEVRIKSMKGELIYKTLLLQLIGDRFLREKDRQEVIVQQTRYQSLFVLSIFLNQGTNFRVLLPEFGGKQPDYYGLLTYALLFEAAEAPDHHYVNLAPWFSGVKNTKEWIDSHVNFERTYPSVDGKDIVWRTGASGDVKWKESVLHEYEYAAPSSTTVPPSLSHHFDDHEPPFQRRDHHHQQQQQSFHTRTMHTSRDDQAPRYSREVRESRHSRPNGEDNTYEQRSNTKRSDTRNDRQHSSATSSAPMSTVKAVTEPKVLPFIPYRNFIDISPNMGSVLTKEAKIYTEKYGNTLNFTPNPQAGHEWNDLRLRSNTIYGETTTKTWTGAQCTHCQAFLARCKVNNKYWNLFILGFTECPNRPVGEWIESYRQRMNHKYVEQEEFLQDKFTYEELCEWGFANDEAAAEEGEGK